MKRYNEFLESLTGTDPVSDAKKVRAFVHTPYTGHGLGLTLDMWDVFRGLLIESVQGRYPIRLSRSGEGIIFKAEVNDYDDRENCARVVGIWVLNRYKGELKDLGYSTVAQADNNYAYAFAMELVLPEAELRERVKLERLNAICNRFGVSADMLYRRMQELELL